jgi:tRNA U34 2-thiouridine synthase MnmA/TrmU
MFACSFSSDMEIGFETPEKGVSPGQVVGLWDERGTWCLGSGVIDSTECLE